MGKRPRGVEVCVDEEGRTHPARMECRAVPEARVGGEGQARPLGVPGRVMLLLTTTVDIY